MTELVEAYRSMGNKTAQESRDEKAAMLAAVRGLCDLTESGVLLWEEGDGSTEDEVAVGLLREAMQAYNLASCPEDELNDGNDSGERITQADLLDEANFLMEAALAVSVVHGIGGWWLADEDAQ